MKGYLNSHRDFHMPTIYLQSHLIVQHYWCYLKRRFSTNKKRKKMLIFRESCEIRDKFHQNYKQILLFAIYYSFSFYREIHCNFVSSRHHMKIERGDNKQEVKLLFIQQVICILFYSNGSNNDTFQMFFNNSFLQEASALKKNPDMRLQDQLLCNRRKLLCQQRVLPCGFLKHFMAR